MPAQHSFGTSFKWNNQLVALLTAINGIETSVSTQNSTTHQSSDAYTDYVLGILTAGDVTISGLFDPTDSAGQQAMLADMNSRTKRTAVITFPAATGTSWTFTGGITSLKIGDAPVDGLIPFTATIKPSGKPTLAVATSAGLTAPYFALSESAVLTPAASGSAYDYVATVLTGVTSITVTPTASAGTITVNGNVVASGEASSAIPLGAAGSVTTITVVVTETDKAPKTYTIRVVRAA